MKQGLDTVHDSCQLGVWTSHKGTRDGKTGMGQGRDCATIQSLHPCISMQRIQRHARTCAPGMIEHDGERAVCDCKDVAFQVRYRGPCKG